MNDETENMIPILDLTPEVEELRGEFRAAFDRVMDSGQFILGSEVRAFESEVAGYLRVKHAIGVNSGTDALIIGLRALGIGPGDEVITTPFSFFATAEAISNVGAKPVFVDVDENTFNIDPSLIDGAVTSRTKALLPVHLYGQPVEMGEIMQIAGQHGLQVIEDCAQSFGATYKGIHTGTIGNVGAYSFFPSKNLGAFGDGGLIATNDDGIAETVRKLRTHGSTKQYHNEMLGYNSRLDELQAAFLRVKLPHIDRWNERRRDVARRYNELLAHTDGLRTPKVVDGHVFHQYTVRMVNGDRSYIRELLAHSGITTKVYYPTTQDRLAVYAGKYAEFNVSHRLATQVLSLPIWPSIEPAVQARVASHLVGLASGDASDSN